MFIILIKEQTIFTQEQINILFDSESIKSHQNLKQLLSSFKQKRKPMHLNDIQDLYKSDYSLYSTIVQAKDVLLEDAMKEWEYAGFVSSNNKICSLCGNTQLKENYRIVNKLNNKEMLIGSTCRSKFKKFIPDAETKNKEKIQIKSINRIKEINYLVKDYLEKNDLLNVEDLLEMYKIFYRDFPIILPKEIDQNLINLIKESDKFYKEFVSGKINKNEVIKFSNYIDEFKELKIKADKFYYKYNSHLLICDTKIIKWIDKLFANDKTIKESIKNNNGFINKYSAKKIYSYDFIKKFENRINIYFEKNKYKLVRLDDEGIVISYKTIENFNVDLVISLKRFSEYFSYVLFNKTNSNDTNFILTKFDVLWEYDNVDQYLYIINTNRIDKTPYRLSTIDRNGNLARGIRI